MIGKRNRANKIHKCCQIIGSPNLGSQSKAGWLNAKGATAEKSAEKGREESVGERQAPFWSGG